MFEKLFWDFISFKQCWCWCCLLLFPLQGAAEWPFCYHIAGDNNPQAVKRAANNVSSLLRKNESKDRWEEPEGFTFAAVLYAQKPTLHWCIWVSGSYLFYCKRSRVVMSEGTFALAAAVPWACPWTSSSGTSVTCPCGRAPWMWWWQTCPLGRGELCWEVLHPLPGLGFPHRGSELRLLGEESWTPR